MEKILFLWLCLVCVSQAVCPLRGGHVGAIKALRHRGPSDLNMEFVPATKSGCTCVSACQASLLTDGAKCDWCYVEENCGMKGWRGWWDWCSYPKKEEYEALTAAFKLDWLWGQIRVNQKSGSYPFGGGILLESVQTTFDNQWDVMPPGRTKYIHSVGAVCKFTFTTDESSPYTGVFRAGEVTQGLIRMGSALPVTLKSGIVPGLGLKFLRNGVHSGNFVALVKLGAQSGMDYNFFKGEFSNIIPSATGFTALLAKKFNQASQCAPQVGLSDICKYGSNGEQVPLRDVRFPAAVKLRARVRTPSDPMTQEELQRHLTSIPKDSVLFEFYSYDSYEEFHNGEEGTFLGSLVVNGDGVGNTCVNSAFGDSKLFFRHQRIEEDWSLAPHRMRQVDAQKDCSIPAISVQVPKMCPSHPFYGLLEGFANN